ncbi:MULTISPECIES: YcjF family protein [unclassified Cyanobium]|uniref:YcjF family protein n=1 Tax=unclassified Cyanobium TaxID=2627006 RepID=UPI0020CDB15B|nr:MULTISPECIES: YcjF family protein [unclassified Cyanobium]MCP9858550.1 YcjF family protein [Cyanobium sp. Cruz-8H5]MCP9865794.1 YcjF family protein [Cyanobium sp. Cruz-8D1]
MPQDPLRPAALPSLLSSLLSAGWGRQGLLLAGGVLGGEFILRSLPGEGWGLMGLAGIAAGWWWLGRRPARLATSRLPSSFEAWLRRCDDLLVQFERLEGEPGEGQARRREGLAALREEGNRPGLHLALVGSVAPDAAWAPQLQRALRGRLGLSLRWGEALPAVSQERRWPDGLAAADVVLFHLVSPLRAADLRWLEAVPVGQPVWLLVQPEAPCDPQALVAELVSQWPAAAPERVLSWDGRPDALTASLQPLARWLSSDGAALRRATPLRRSEDLHRHWQAELELLRRQRLMQLQQRTQWVVATGVFAAPLASMDLVVLAAANGLMLQEMARLWDCPWSVEQLKAAAVELAKASLLLGVVEWSSQALAAAVRLHGATWLVGGALQALSAAYLTRVVCHAMADVLALSAGVEAPDLERIKREAPLLVARAAEAEKLDWPGFLQQGRDWLGQQLASLGTGSLPAST